jgi:hypothetical protein
LDPGAVLAHRFDELARDAATASLTSSTGATSTSCDRTATAQRCADGR